MYFDARFHYAEVEGDHIIFEGRSVSPAQMANSIAGGTSNAWHDLWALLPGEPAWKLASVRRQQARNIEKAIAASAAMPSGQMPTAQMPTAQMPSAAMPARAHLPAPFRHATRRSLPWRAASGRLTGPLSA